MDSGCGCKEVYTFPHITYPYSSCNCSFFSSNICDRARENLTEVGNIDFEI